LDNVTMEDLRSLLNGRPGWRVSIYMPAHRAGRETQQDPIRFRNLVRTADERLRGEGLRSPEAAALLAPAHRLLEDPGFWRNQSDGLAVFLSAHESRAYRLPIPFPELAVIGGTYHLKPLLPLVTSGGRFYVLALSQNQIRLLEGTPHTVDEIELRDLPTSLAEAIPGEASERQVQYHTGTAARSGMRAAVFHGHDLADEAKNRIVRWFRQIDEYLRRELGGSQAPLVLAGVEYLMPLYAETNTYPMLMERGIAGNPDDLRPAELHTRAWELVKPHFGQARDGAAALYRQLEGTGRTTADLAEVVLAAHHGRIDVLFAANGVQIWGKYDASTNSVSVHHGPEPRDGDLLDLAAIQSVMTGGTVFVVDPDEVPGKALVAAVLRY
jgi:hypothetical protein